MSPVLQIVAVLVSITSLAWAIFVTLKKGDFKRPTLNFKAGYTGPAKKIGGLNLEAIKWKDCSTIIYFARLNADEIGIFPLHFCLQNVNDHGQAPARSVRVIFNFPRAYYYQDMGLIERLKFNDGRKLRLTVDAKERTANTFGESVFVAYEYLLFRPGEGLMTMEPLIFRYQSPLSLAENARLEKLSVQQRLRCSGASAYFALDVFVAAENCAPVSKRYNIIWINSDLPRDGAEPMLERLARGFSGEDSVPGLYGKHPWEKPPFRWENAELLQLDMADATSAKQKFRVAEHEPLAVTLGALSMPNWNYHDEQRPAALDRYFRRAAPRRN